MSMHLGTGKPQANKCACTWKRKKTIKCACFLKRRKMRQLNVHAIETCLKATDVFFRDKLKMLEIYLF
jgi:hypothetical protein